MSVSPLEAVWVRVQTPYEQLVLAVDWMGEVVESDEEEDGSATVEVAETDGDDGASVIDVDAC